MFIAILFVSFMQISLFGADALTQTISLEEESLSWAAQQEIQTRAVAYTNQCKSDTIVNLRDDLDLRSLLIYNKICGKKDNEQSLAWVLSHKDSIYAEAETLGVDLADYRANIELYDAMSDYNDNAIAFAEWLSTTAQNSIKDVRSWALSLEKRQIKLTQLHSRLDGFYNTALEDIMPSSAAIIAFILAEPGDALRPLLVANRDDTHRKVEKYVTDVFFPEDENDENESDVA